MMKIVMTLIRGAKKNGKSWNLNEYDEDEDDER